MLEVSIESIGDQKYTGTVTEVDKTANSSSGVTSYSDPKGYQWVIRENGDEVDFRAEYRIRLPFRVFTLSAVPFSARSRKHGWTGSDKKAGGGGSSGGREDKTVYVGRDSTRYHCSASCHYISNEIHRVSARSLPGLRNESGSSYRPCRVCGGADASEYFVLPSGETYHTKANCSSLSYYVRAVPLSEVEHLGPCSYCGGG